jgi:4-hydroxybenzoate polyprenyltransferase
MTAAVRRWKVYLRLGRVSNLPTVWTNVAAGAWLAGAPPSPALLVLVAAAMSLFYTGGMFLNDAFDREIDARQRPDRPIAAGLVGAGHVFGVGFGLLAAGEILVGCAAVLASAGGAPLIGGAALAGAIVLYDAWHKQNPVSPVLMGMCRALVYVTAALVARPLVPAARFDVAGPGPSALVMLGAVVAWCYLIGLTYAAKQEAVDPRSRIAGRAPDGSAGTAGELSRGPRGPRGPRAMIDRLGRLWPLAFLSVPFVFGAPLLTSWGLTTAVYVALLAVVVHALRLLRGHAPDRFPRAIMMLIGGISLLDAVLVGRAGGSTAAVLVTAAGFPATLGMQRWVRGT